MANALALGLIALTAFPAGAGAATATPILTATTPASPGTATEPRIRGNADGIITSVVGPRSRGLTRALEPGAAINLYTDAACTGSVVASGTAAELEGAGIAVKVGLDSETTFYANQTGFAGTSGCSNGITYRQVSSAPAAPAFSGVTPASGANENFPRLQGNVDPGAIVYIFDTPGCNGSPRGSGTAAEFAGAGIEVNVPDNSTTTFFAMATLAGIPSGCSVTSITYQEVTPAGGVGESGGGSPGGGSGGTAAPPSNGAAKPPAPRLRTVPGSIANNALPTIVGSAPQAAKVMIFNSLDCSGGALWSGPAPEFAAGVQVAMTPNTTAVFTVRSVDSDGDRSACSDPVAYTDDSIAPRTRITLGPGVKTVHRTVVFRFADITGGPQTHFLCKVDRRPWKECNAPLKLKHLGLRKHVLKVKAYDAAGNREKRPVRRSFQVIRSS
ncbi:MAG TPA: hypothetical protein VLR46_11945 [Candidatus Dormibacteraeota bacterium]|nr:hypothetical protein [Candidatus Dormibacteraeota bacterium]